MLRIGLTEGKSAAIVKRLRECMMRRTGTILTLTLLAAALCADRSVAAVADSRPQVVETARLVVRRLTTGLQPRTAIVPQRCPLVASGIALPAPTIRVMDAVIPPGAVCLPGQLPIPPPVV